MTKELGSPSLALPSTPSSGALSEVMGALRARFTGDTLTSRRVEFSAAEDEFEALFARGWTDGLPVVPPTRERVLRMLTGTTRSPSDIVAIAPPDLVDLTVEKIAINAVMANSDILQLTIDMDVFAACHAPGVSALSYNGIAPNAMFKRLLRHIVFSGKVWSVDIAELNPRYDIDSRTARLAASLIFDIVQAADKNAEYPG